MFFVRAAGPHGIPQQDGGEPQGATGAADAECTRKRAEGAMTVRYPFSTCYCLCRCLRLPSPSCLFSVSQPVEVDDNGSQGIGYGVNGLSKMQPRIMSPVSSRSGAQEQSLESLCTQRHIAAAARSRSTEQKDAVMVELVRLACL